jgi:acetyl-CoA carboxylase biotin carboxyl carrier protein
MTATLPSTGSEPEESIPRDFDLTGALSALCGSVADVVAITASQPSRVSVSVGSVRLEAEWPVGEVIAPAVPVAGHPAAPAVAPAETRNVLRAPLVGSFYRAPEPGAAAFVEVGDVVQTGDQIGIIEAMKLMNPIIAEQPGRIVEILVDDAEPVEFDQALLVIEPDGRG